MTSASRIAEWLPGEGRTPAEIRDAVYLVGENAGPTQSRFWLLLVLSACIATAGIVSDSTATVIGAMIVAPLAVPIRGTAVAIAYGELRPLLLSVAIVISAMVLVVAIGARLAVVLPELSPPADNFQITGRVSPTIVDLVAAGTTGLAGAIAVGRRDIGDILPGVAIAISLVPPLAVAGVTAVDGPWHDALGALLLFLTIRGPHHGDVGTDVVEPDDAVHPTPLVRRLAFQLHTELGEERFGRLEVVDNDENVSIRWIVIGLPVSWGAPVGALHLVSGAGQSFSTSNRSFGSQIVA